MSTSEPSVLQQCADRIFPIDQAVLQQTLEQTLFTYCDSMSPGERGMHWSFDWLFAPREAVAIALGRFFEADDGAYCYVALRHQSNRIGGTRGIGVVYELRLPVGAFRFDPSEGRLSIVHDGPAAYKILRLAGPDDDLTEAIEGQGLLHLDVEKLLWRPAMATAGSGRRWACQGEVSLHEDAGGPRVCEWRWSYSLAETVDRPDYDARQLLWILRTGCIPSRNGHFIPAMRASLASGAEVVLSQAEEPEVCLTLEGAYLDGNFARAREGDVVTDRWAWMAAPQLWDADGNSTEHMLTFGFFQKALIPLIQKEDHWSGAILWRSGPTDMTRFTALALLDSIAVSFHSRRYLDVTFITHDRSHRITVRAWSHTITTPMTTPSGQAFRDHQDLLADAYVVIERNLLPPWQRLLRAPRWEQEARLVTNMFGFEFGEKDLVIGNPGYPAYAAVPELPTWFVQALSKIPGELGHLEPAPRLEPINR